MNIPKRAIRKIRRHLLGGLGPDYVPAPKISSYPETERTRVLICALGPRGFIGPGKVDPNYFFPTFVKILHDNNIGVYFLSNKRDISKLSTNDTCTIHVYREVAVTIDANKIHDRGLVYNRPELGPSIADKIEANTLLRNGGVCVPKRFDEPVAGIVFSNAVKSTNSEVFTDYRKGRYNTEYIDTKVDFKGSSYFTTVRMMCVGRAMLHAYVRARNVAEGNPSVHASDTPLDPELNLFLQRTQINRKYEQLIHLARQLGDVLGPGFYAHDILLDRESDRLYVCETGFKFNDSSYTKHMESIKHELPWHSIMFSEEFARMSAVSFLSESIRLGALKGSQSHSVEV